MSQFLRILNTKCLLLVFFILVSFLFFKDNTYAATCTGSATFVDYSCEYDVISDYYTCVSNGALEQSCRFDADGVCSAAGPVNCFDGPSGCTISSFDTTVGCSVVQDTYSCQDSPNCSVESGACGEAECPDDERLIRRFCDDGQGGTLNCSYCQEDDSCVPPAEGGWSCADLETSTCTYSDSGGSYSTEAGCESECVGSEEPQPSECESTCGNNVCECNESETCSDDCESGGACADLVTWGHCDEARVPGSQGTDGCILPPSILRNGTNVNIDWECNERWGINSGVNTYPGLALYKINRQDMEEARDTGDYSYIESNFLGVIPNNQSEMTFNTNDWNDFTVTATPSCLVDENLSPQFMDEALESGCYTQAVVSGDTQEPVCGGWGFNPGQPTNADSISVTSTATDDESGIDEAGLYVSYSPLDQNWNGWEELTPNGTNSTGSIDGTWSTSGNSSGEYILASNWWDNAGNIQQCTATFLLDKTMPQCGEWTFSPNEPSGNNPINIVSRASDEHTSIVQNGLYIAYAPDSNPGDSDWRGWEELVQNGASTDTSVSASWSTPDKENGNYLVASNWWDDAGNFRQCRTYYNFQNTPPVCTLDASENFVDPGDSVIFNATQDSGDSGDSIISTNWDSSSGSFSFTNDDGAIWRAPSTYNTESQISYTITDGRFESSTCVETVRTSELVYINGENKDIDKACGNQTTSDNLNITYSKQSDSPAQIVVDTSDNFLSNNICAIADVDCAVSPSTINSNGSGTAQMQISFPTGSLRKDRYYYRVFLRTTDSSGNTIQDSDISYVDINNCDPVCPSNPVLENIDPDKQEYERNEDVELTAAEGSDAESDTGDLNYIMWDSSAGGINPDEGKTVVFTTSNQNDTSSQVWFRVADEDYDSSLSVNATGNGLSDRCVYSETFDTVSTEIISYFNPSQISLPRSGGEVVGISDLEIELENDRPGTASMDTTNPTVGGYTNICVQPEIECVLDNGNPVVPNANPGNPNPNQDKELEIIASGGTQNLDPQRYAALATVSASNSQGDSFSDTALLLVDVENRDPSVTITNVDGFGIYGDPPYENYYADLEYTFTGEIDDDDGDLLDYNWDSTTGAFTSGTTSDTNIAPPINSQVGLTPGSYRQEGLSPQVTLQANDDFGGSGSDAELIFPPTALPEFDFELEIKQDKNSVYAEEDYAELCEGEWNNPDLDQSDEPVNVTLDTGPDGDECTYADDGDDDCEYTTDNGELTQALRERVEEIGGNNYGQNYVMSLDANYSDNNFRILCVRDVDEDSTNPSNTMPFEGERESTRTFRAVVGLPAFDAWMQSVGGSIYSYGQPTFSLPYDPNRVALSFRGNVYSLTDETVPYSGSGPGSIADFGNLAAGSSDTINVNPTGADFVKNDYSIENCSGCAPQLSQFNEILNQSFVGVQEISDISNLDSSGGGAYEYTSNTIGDSGNPNEDIELSEFNDDSSGVVVVYVEGDLNIESNLVKPNTQSTNVVFVVNDNLNIHHSVLRVDAGFIVEGSVSIDGEGDGEDDPLIVNGFVWTTQQNIEPGRSSENKTRFGPGGDPDNYANSRPIETFVLYPNLFTGDGYEEYPKNFVQTPIYITALE